MQHKIIGATARLGKVGFLGLIRLILKHWYLFIVLIVILPSIFSAISHAYETRNYSYPFIVLGLRLTNADTIIADDVETLKTNPQELIGMNKPSEGIYQTVKYYFYFTKNVIWRLIGSIFLITVPFMFFYKYNRFKGSKGLQSSKSADIGKALIYGVIFVFFINLVLVIHSLLIGNPLLEVPQKMDFFQETWFIVKNTLPFHGVFSLIKFLIGIP